MSLAKWASKNASPSRSPEMARELLRAQPGGPNVAVPLRFVPRDVYESTLPVRDLNALIDRAPVVDVPFSNLVAIQHTISKARVEQYLDKPTLRRAGTRDPKHGGLIDLPIVIRYRGVCYLHDGHHRVTAAKMMGMKSVRARYVDLDAENRT